MSELIEKERRALRLLQSAARGGCVEVAYSGGKDSDIILALAKEAGIEFRAIHKCTTIDRPQTLAHCKEVGAEIRRADVPFLKMIERKGFPSRWVRWCCQVYKEYPILRTCVIGVRAEESKARAERYKEPTQCRMFPNEERVEQVYPLLDWTLEDEKEYIKAHRLKLHPYYYDELGNVDVSRRLGCIGCPLRGDRGREDFQQFPKMLRQWVRHGQVWWDAPMGKDIKKSKLLFSDVYALLYNNLFARGYADMVKRVEKIGGQQNCRAFLEDYFKIDL